MQKKPYHKFLLNMCYQCYPPVSKFIDLKVLCFDSTGKALKNAKTFSKVAERQLCAQNSIYPFLSGRAFNNAITAQLLPAAEINWLSS